MGYGYSELDEDWAALGREKQDLLSVSLSVYLPESVCLSVPLRSICLSLRYLTSMPLRTVYMSPGFFLFVPLGLSICLLGDCLSVPLGLSICPPGHGHPRMPSSLRASGSELITVHTPALLAGELDHGEEDGSVSAHRCRGPACVGSDPA